MRVLLMGSGAFGLPTFESLGETHEIVAVVSQPDRPAGRRRRMTPTPASVFALDRKLPLHRPERINDPTVVADLRTLDCDAWVIIAYGQKLPPELLENRFAINLHGSLLPRWRGAAPIARAMLAGDTATGVSVIALAQQMDAGAVFAQRSIDIDPTHTAGEVHDRLARLGPDLIAEVLDAHATGSLTGLVQDPGLVTHAARLQRSDALLDLLRGGDHVRRTINGCSPWPACTAHIDGVELRLLRAAPAPAPGTETGSPAETDQHEIPTPAGQIDRTGLLGTTDGRVRLLEVQPAGGRPMAFQAWANGRQCTWPTGLEPTGLDTDP